MSSYPQSPAEYPAPARPQKGWFGRNWWWFIPFLILTPFCCCCGSCGGLFYYGLSQVENMGAYKDSIADAQNNAEVQAELGTPIEAKGLFGSLTSGGQFNVQQTTAGITINAAIPISGPKGTGILYIDSDGDAAGQNWTYTRREVVIDGSGKVIDLLPAGTSVPNAQSDDEGAEGQE